MRLVRRGVYRCTLCEDTVFTPTSDTLPEFTLAAGSGDVIERVVTVRDNEVHRCLLPSLQGTDEPIASIRDAHGIDVA